MVFFLFAAREARADDHATDRIVGPAAKDFDHNFYYDPHARAFHLIKENVACMFWSPDCKRLLLLLHYAVTRPSGAASPTPLVAQTGPDYLNYGPRSEAFALLIVDTVSNRMSPVKLPFTVTRLPDCISWWDNQSIVLIGNLTNRTLVNQNCPSRPGLVRVNLRDSSCEQIIIPGSVFSVVDENGGNIGFGETVRFSRELSLVYVSFWKCQVTGGGDGVVFFDLKGARVGVDDLLDRNLLRDAIELPGGFAGGNKYWNVPKKRVVSTPRSVRKWARGLVDEALSPDGKLASIGVLPKTRIENGQKIVDMTGPEALLTIRDQQR